MMVFVKKVERYELNEIKHAIKSGLEKINFSLEGKKSAVLKPNLVLGLPPSSGVITHPLITRGTIEILKEHCIKDITILEGPGLGQDPDQVFSKTGYSKMAEEMGVNILCTDKVKRKKLKWEWGNVQIPVILLESDLYINLPKLKTHGLTVVTLALKNQKGIVPAPWKKLIHNHGLHQPIVDLYKVIKPDLSIIDGIEGMQGEGPVKGSIVKSHVIVMGENAVETDIAGSRLMGIKLDEVKHLKFATEQGFGRKEPEITGDDPESLLINYKRADPEWGRVLKVCSRRNPYACSMCVIALSRAIKMALKNPRYWKFIAKFSYYALIEGINIIQGKGEPYIPERGWSVCFGKCTREIAEKYNLPHIPGCPPEPEDVLNYFFKIIEKREDS
ncbi:MAG: DUF362 domain-containing protein [Candidatus Eremiobacteraeota bacterium]|nr:DUF362 domain-containing protein [Candidatus Eremiobacteraeota bacterium]